MSDVTEVQKNVLGKSLFHLFLHLELHDTYFELQMEKSKCKYFPPNKWKRHKKVIIYLLFEVYCKFRLSQLISIILNSSL